ncbi:TPA: hypothetical protein R1931_002324 [Staphylococcus delphini]|nr:hypothetical protein [Staphylococcus delphini]HEC2192913.1 hypothetical protein [Staphylococcus delphini]HEC2201096.1 hypothetical protein [Staphylococcus delphini]
MNKKRLLSSIFGIIVGLLVLSMSDALADNSADPIPDNYINQANSLV